MKTRDYTLKPGEKLFIEGKHGIIIVSMFSQLTRVTVNEKTDAKRGDE